MSRTPFGAVVRALAGPVGDVRAPRLGLPGADRRSAGGTGPSGHDALQGPTPPLGLAAEGDVERQERTSAGQRRNRGGVGDGDGAPLDPTDPMLRALATPLERVQAPAAATPASDPVEATARVSLEQVMQRLVRRIAWSGDARTGTARIELGAGELAGGTLLLQADGGEVRVTLEVPAGVDASAWRERLGRRLAARGLCVASLDVT